MIDVYGPFKDGDCSEKIFENSRVDYCGVLPPEKVLPTLSQYDVLLLPSFHPGEGYPGIVIEAFSLGLPVIATNWQAIPEIVQDGENGLLVSPQRLRKSHTCNQCLLMRKSFRSCLTGLKKASNNSIVIRLTLNF